jgi:hypothetical protein
MKRLIAFVLFLSLVIGLLSGCRPQFQPGAYTDDMGRTVDITHRSRKCFLPLAWEKKWLV